MGLLNTTTAPERTTPHAWLMMGLGVISTVLMLGQLAEDSTLGGFYASRVALWNGGAYSFKLHLVLVWLTVFAIVSTPINLVREVVVFFKALRRAKAAQPVSVPLGWDTQQRRRRLTRALFTLGGAVAWVGFSAVAVMAPALLLPISWLAVVLTITIPLGPLLVPTLLFSALVPPRFVTGVVEEVGGELGGKLARVRIEGETFYATPQMLNAISEGQNVQLLVTGESVQRIQLR